MHRQAHHVRSLLWLLGLERSDTGNLLNVNGRFRRISEAQIRFSREAESLVGRERVKSQGRLLSISTTHHFRLHIHPSRP
ncbi:hypothetical protein B0T18DRAFT_400723 [Schizothecium vesticola]|uniref:Uncharacterized protein n=1 Tax=Schizothecium vesticola TaxID=314040 RepID=A0AA40KDF7_9PEZI|nr:hypothetical protein B0T18DRAFT_400723 [Schizothecium vesticola]